MSTNMSNNLSELSAAPWISTTESSFILPDPDYEFVDFLQLPSDTMETFMELGTIPEVKSEETTNLAMDENDLLMDIMSEIGIGSPDSSSSSSTVCDLESTQSLIDEVETYLQTVEEKVPRDVTTPLKINTAIPMDQGPKTSRLSQPKSMDKKSETDKIFDALTSGKVYHEDQDTKDLDFKNAFTTSVTGEDGQQVIIIIAPPSSPPPLIRNTAVTPPPVSPNFSLSPSAVPSPLSPGMASDDSDWSPAVVAGNTTPRTTGKQRKKYERKVRTAYPPVTPYPKEKKERKKAQNRTAAYKYREKKKAEWDKVDQELDELTERNASLKKRVSDMEVELRCLKKLMMETGLGDYIR